MAEKKEEAVVLQADKKQGITPQLSAAQETAPAPATPKPAPKPVPPKEPAKPKIDTALLNSLICIGGYSCLL